MILKKGWFYVVLVGVVVIIYALNTLTSSPVQQENTNQSIQWGDEKKSGAHPSVVVNALPDKKNKHIQSADIEKDVNIQTSTMVEGVDRPTGLKLNADGLLVVEPKLIEFYEYYKLAYLHLNNDEFMSVLNHLIEKEVPDTAKMQAKLLLSQYNEYRQKKAELGEGVVPSLEDGGPELRQTFSQVEQLQNDVFGAEVAQALFSEDRAYINYALGAREAFETISKEQDRAAIDLERIQKLKVLSEDLPEEAKASVQFDLKFRELQVRSALLKKQNATPEQWFEMREALFGTEVAERMAKADEAKLNEKLNTPSN